MLSRRFRSRITCWDFSGFAHKFGSDACFSISANCWRSLLASKILPQVVNLGLERSVLLFQFFQHNLFCSDLNLNYALVPLRWSYSAYRFAKDLSFVSGHRFSDAIYLLNEAPL